MAGLDLAAALARVDGDKELLKEIAEIFLEEYPGTVSEIRNAIAAKDPEALQRAAHSLKGSIGNFGSGGAYEAALRLEQMGRQGELDQSEQALKELENTLEILTSQLVKL